ncbi:JAB domain-containing protein [Sphingopyxis sp. BSN-002]|uniref:JAB domain-containing protein n=1 Tax=Sphingopyxis sp. BSN-002 TaxID=2911495 RepID=UPI001EDB1CA1|nr:JAB domain-containing protein [Sphingopyxis sp. BSN-002]UKK84661.1 JAB domain-containing protein [Sphingopyxis sp. BSN-002]
MTLFEPVGLPPPTAIAAGFVPREAEDELARQLLRPMFAATGESMLLAGFDAYARLVGFEDIAGDPTGRCVIVPQSWRRLLGRPVAAVVMAHNHPSGIARPSEADIACTREPDSFCGSRASIFRII